MTSNQISDTQLRNVRAWAAARPRMYGSEAIVALLDELLTRRDADMEPGGRPVFCGQCGREKGRILGPVFRAGIHPDMKHAPCGCSGLFHEGWCSDQNVLDPWGSILNHQNREQVRAMAARLIADLLRALDAKQAKIDALMIEFCPGDREQLEEWAKHQVPVVETTAKPPVHERNCPEKPS